jgi:hypothetical protein
MLVGVDAKALEWKTLVEYSRDPVALKEIESGVDIHLVNQKDLVLPSRLISKKYLFRTIYNRGKGYAFTVDPDFMHVSTSVDYWDERGQKFYKKYDAVNELHLRWMQDIQNQGYIESMFGRRWEVPLFDSYGKLNWNSITNHPNQGLGADIMMIARISMFNRVKAQPWGKHVKWIQTVHDSCLADVPNDLTQPMINLYHEVFADIPKNIKKIFNYTWVVPLQCEAYAGPNQKDTEEMPPKY